MLFASAIFFASGLLMFNCNHKTFAFIFIASLAIQFKNISNTQNPQNIIAISKIINQEEVRRSYSLCSCANSNILSIGVKRIENGLMSNYLTKDLIVGDFLNVMQPNGTFCLNDEKKVVAICAGSGITPILSMLKSNDRNFTLIYGNKSQSSSMLSLIHI